MASTPTASHPVLFTTKTPYPLPSQKFMIPSTWKRYQLSQLINKALALAKVVPFDFIIRGGLLRGSLGDWARENEVGEEETLEIEYIESAMPPEKISEIPLEEWVSSVSCQISGHFLAASYDGSIRSYNYSQQLVSSARTHLAPITSICVVPSTSNRDGEAGTYVVASASHDLTAQLTRFCLSPASAEPRPQPKALTTLHLHTGPLSSISASPSGSHLLTSSWDGLIGLWDSAVPDVDEVPHEQEREGKKRRKVDDSRERPKRKAPLSVLKSHTARVSKVVFGKDQGKTAFSCGFDSTVRTWDIESGVCTSTINAPEKPMVDLALTADGNVALASSTDRTITLYDVRTPTSTTTIISSLSHSATPSCIAPSPLLSSHRIASGSYDGVVRLWDLRSVRSATASFQAWNGVKKVLSIDWAGGVVGVGGEGGMEIWKVGDGDLEDA